jgi:hypothetical protein
VSDVVARQRRLTPLYQGDRDKGALNLCDKKGNGSASRLVVTSFLPLLTECSRARHRCLATTPDTTCVDDCQVLMYARDHCYRPHFLVPLYCNVVEIENGSAHIVIIWQIQQQNTEHCINVTLLYNQLVSTQKYN